MFRLRAIDVVRLHEEETAMTWKATDDTMELAQE